MQVPQRRFGALNKSTSCPPLSGDVAEVVAAIDAENAGSEDAGATGGEGSDGGSASKGAALPRRDGKQMDLLLEVESLEPKQLMSVCGITSCQHKYRQLRSIITCNHIIITPPVTSGSFTRTWFALDSSWWYRVGRAAPPLPRAAATVPRCPLFRVAFLEASRSLCRDCFFCVFRVSRSDQMRVEK